MFYVPNEKKMPSLKVFFILTDFFNKLIIINENGAGSLRLLRNYRAKTLTRASMWFWREEHNTHPTPIDYAPGIVILAGIVKIMPALLTNQMTGIFWLDV